MRLVRRDIWMLVTILGVGSTSAKPLQVPESDAHRSNVVVPEGRKKLQVLTNNQNRLNVAVEMENAPKRLAPRYDDKSDIFIARVANTNELVGRELIPEGRANLKAEELLVGGDVKEENIRGRNYIKKHLIDAPDLPFITLDEDPFTLPHPVYTVVPPHEPPQPRVKRR